MRSKAGIMLMLLGTVLLLGALILMVHNYNESKEAGAFADEVLAAMEADMADDYPDGLDPYNMTIKTYEGWDYVGYLVIPSQDLKLPVMAALDEFRLSLSPCLYTGSAKLDNMVIGAHNFSTHFGKIANLKPGDEIVFVDFDKNIYYYDVDCIEILQPNQVEHLTESEYPLTMFTCTYGGQTRVTVRCVYDKKMGRD